MQTIRPPTGFSGSLRLYPGLMRIAGPPLAAWHLKRRAARGKEDPARLGERRGIAGRARPEGPMIWIHAASVGEALSTLPLIRALRADCPETGLLMTTGTVSSAALMAERLPKGAIHQYVPLDIPAYANAFLDHWRPDLALWLESDLWPNLLRQTAQRQIPIFLVNARMSASSFRSWQRFPRSAASLLSQVEACFAQSETSATHFRALGCPHVSVAGNLKLAADPLPADQGQLIALDKAMGGRPRWLAASTHDGEESQIAHAHLKLKQTHPDLLTVIAPRHPDRGPAIAAALRGQGLTVAMRSDGALPASGTDIYLADTLGELGLLYRLSDIAFLGGSLIPHGGQNPLEATRLACAVLHGPQTHNFEEIYEGLAGAGATRTVADADSLAAAVAPLLDDPGAVKALVDAARPVTQQADHVVNRLMAEIGTRLGGRPPAPSESSPRGRKTPAAGQKGGDKMKGRPQA